MGDLILGGHHFFLVRGPNNEIANSWIEEDASPTAVQTAEGAPDAANVPTAATEYSSFGGNVGLDERVRAPGDFARWFVTDWDGTRSTQATSWVRWPGDTVALTGGGVGVTIPGKVATGFEHLQSAVAILDDPTATGFVSTKVNGGAGEFYTWDGTSFVLSKTTTAHAVPSFGAVQVSFKTGNYFLPNSVPVVMSGTAQWMPDVNGHVYDLVANAASGTFADYVVPFYDMVLALASNGKDVFVTAYKPIGTTVKTESASVSGGIISTATTDATTTLQGAKWVMGALACEGVLWFTSVNAVWAIQWNDQYNIFKSEELFRVPRITGPPVNFNGEVYIPCGNRLAHINPGTKGYDWIKIDQFDVMPPPFNGRIVECVPTPDALYCKVVEDGDFANSVRAAIMRFDAQGTWSCVICDQAPDSTIARMPLVRTFDTSNPPAIGYWVDGTHIRLLPVQDSGRNPRTMTVTSRPQAPQVRGVSPNETGVARSNQKQALRYRIEVEDCVAQGAVKVYYQFPPIDRVLGAPNTFTTGAAANTGTWHPCGVIHAGIAGYSGQIDSNGNGWVFIEFDGATSYPGVGILPLYPHYVGVSWCIEINGDPTGAHVPTVRGFRTDREEYISKTKVITARIELSAGMRRRGKHDGDAAATDTVRDSDWVQREMAVIESMVAGERTQTLVTPKGKTYEVEISKWQEVLREFDDEGPNSVTVQLSMKVIPFLGVF